MLHRYGQTVVAIDSLMFGLEGVTAVYYLPAPRPALIETAPAACLESVLEGLDEEGVRSLDWIIVTHMHLDHAGAVGHLARRFPTARVVVRAEGAPHLTDPRRLWASAARLFPDIERRFGRMRAVPAERIDPVSSDGHVADLGDGRTLEAIHIPGHATHQMALLDPAADDVFVGDALGVYLPDAGLIRPATPPPDFDLELCLESIDRLRTLSPARVFPTHFGPVPDVEAAFEEAATKLREWVAVAAEAVRAGGDLGEVTEAL
ncbi:MAG: MBL fold metallo-hydrolase, partial [Acidimicrobiales bacterium]